FHVTGVQTCALPILRRCDETLAAMAELGLPLLVHGEVTDASVDIFDREAVFLDTVLAPLLARFPRLKVVLEHITTQQAVEFVQQGPENLRSEERRVGREGSRQRRPSARRR